MTFTGFEGGARYSKERKGTVVLRLFLVEEKHGAGIVESSRDLFVNEIVKFSRDLLNPAGILFILVRNETHSL